MGKADETSGAPEEFSELFSDLRSIAKAYGFKILRVTNAAEAMTVIEALTAEVDRLKPFEQLAETGLVLRERLTAETVKEGIRAFGKDFNSDEKTKMLDGLDVDTISQLRDSWKAIGDSLFAGNKRVSEDEVEKSEEAAETEVPPVEPLQTGAVEDEVEDDDIEIGVGV